MNLKQNKMSIRAQFESELNQLRNKFGDDFEIINEAASDKALMGLAQSSNPKDKRKLFDQINNRFFKGGAPFGEPIYMSTFNSKEINNLEGIVGSGKNADTLANIGGKTQGIGRGEIMMAYLIKNCTIGGGSQNYDLTLFDESGNNILDKAEMKQARLNGKGYLYGWRTAANHREFIDIARNDLNFLYDSLKNVMPELAEAEVQSKMARGEGSQFIKIVRDIDPVVIQTPLTFDIKELDGELIISKVGGKPIGALGDKEILRDIRTLLSGQNTTIIKSYKTIEAELIKGMSSVDEKFVFINTLGKNHKFGEFHFYERLPGKPGQMLIDAFTAGTVKVKIKA
jgi:hypothetical protein